MNLDVFFPTLIGSTKFEQHNNIEKELIDYCLSVQKKVKSGGENWISFNTYNTSNGKHEIYFDDKFHVINDWVFKQIKIYCENVGIDNLCLKNNGSWFNVYKKYDYQEKHVHPTSTISAIYILTATKDSAKIFFTTPVNEMFFYKKSMSNQFNANQIQIESVPGTLIIFPSYLPHSVERHDSDSLRISLSYNFKQKE